MKTWYDIKMAKDAAGEDIVDLSVFDYIGYYGVSGKDFIDELKAKVGNATTIRLAINSPGGSVFDAIAMFNALRATGKTIETKVLGIAASAASYLFLAGDKRSMPENTMQMVHNASTGAYGNAEELGEVVDVLNKIDANLQATYATRTGQSAEKIVELLAKDTFLTAAECLELGLCDEVTEAFNATAAFETEKLPANVQAMFVAGKAAIDAAAAAAEKAETDRVAAVEAARVAAEVEAAAKAVPTVEQITDAAKAAGFEAHADVFALAAPKTVADLNAVIENAKQIDALGTVTKYTQLAMQLIRDGKSIADARIAINKARAESTADIDNARRSKESAKSTQSAAASDTSTAGIWALVKN